jgi:hypothetical protein
MSRTLYIRVSARYDIRDFADSYESKSPGLGARFNDAASKAIDALKTSPVLHAIWKRQVPLAPIRKFPFAIPYTVTRTEIEVFAVIPTKSNPSTWPTGS